MGLDKTRGAFVDLECTFQPDLRRTAHSPASRNCAKAVAAAAADGGARGGGEEVHGIDRMKALYREGTQKQVSRRYITPLRDTKYLELL